MRKWIWVAVGLGVAAAAGVAAYAQYDRSLEKPRYSVIDSDGDFELRQYDPMLVAEVTTIGARDKALNAGFRRLAAYIFAQDRPGKDQEEIAMTSPVMQDEKIAMTSPVIQDGNSQRGEGSDTGEWRTRFVMPGKYTAETLPETPSDIAIDTVPGRRMAAIRFSGSPSSDDLAKQEARLREWLGTRGLDTGGAAEYAFYDAPMVPPPMRRNEVMIPVEG
ncbi:SOUL family heme-binding protein [Alteripontixanthobacter maritimus]|nr:heme-binding protein [Alteripontixanthobacter maritimus]